MKFAVGALLTGAVLLGAARSGDALTLDDAVRRAVTASPRTGAARDEAAAADAQAGAASWSRLPKVQAEVGASRTDHPVYVFGGLLTQERFDAAHFGTFDPSAGTFDLSILNHPDPLTNVRSAVTVREPLWTGGAVTSGLHAAEAQSEAARAMAGRTAEETAFDAERAFRMARLAEEKVAVLRGSLSEARAQAVRVDSLWAEGLALKSDRQALAAHELEMEAALAAAQAESAAARSGLGLVMGLDGPVTEALEPPPGDSPGDDPALAEAIEASGDRKDVVAARAQERAAAAGVGLARAQLFPAFELMGTVEHNSKDFFGAGGDQWLVALGARWSLDAGIPGRIRAAGAARRAAQSRATLAREHAGHEVRTAHDNLRAAELQARAYEAAVAAAAESFRLTERRHEEGLATTLDLTQSQNTLIRTRLEAASAREDRALARAALRLAAGLTNLPEDVR